ncbi:MAG: hypothetical protein IPM57_10685 [Oligoflexia bacterium]|nr:hypothetical protein [Oligoflexia bacterium]
MNSLKLENKIAQQVPHPRGRKILFKKEWLALYRVYDRRGKLSFEVEFFQARNRKFRRLIAHEEKKAHLIWQKLCNEIVPLQFDQEKERWIISRIISPPRRFNGARKDFTLNFGPSILARKFEEYCEIQLQKPIERSSKTTVIRICRELLKHSGKSDSLTNKIVKTYFKSKMAPGNHLSPDTLKSDRTEIRRLATWVGIRNLDELFKDIYIPSRSQLRDHGIEFNSRDRRHLERQEVLHFVDSLIKFDDPLTKPVRDALVIQLLFGSRPQEAPCAEILPSSILISGSWKYGRKKSLKTASKGVESIIIPRNKIIDAILFLTNCHPKPIITDDGAKVFQEIAISAFGTNGSKLDRYCLRHTALTWLILTPGLSSKEVGDMAGHMGARMIQDVYASRKVKDQRTWEEAMPLAIRDMPRTWHGFLLECVMVALWPNLKNGKKPLTDPVFQQLGKILKGGKIKREEMDLF